MTGRDSLTLPRLEKGDSVIDERYAVGLVPRRDSGAHKWSVGGLVIVGGAPGYVGAPALCAMAAGRVGAGIVALAVPRSIVAAVAGLVPEASFVPMPEGDPRSSSRRAFDLIQAKLEKAKALVVGPGLGDDEYADALMNSLVSGNGVGGSEGLGFAVPAGDPVDREQSLGILGRGVPAVVDADGLNWLARRPDWWLNFESRTLVLTPHVGEMSRLMNCSTADVIADPVAMARAAAKKWNQIVVLKHGRSVATDGNRALLAPDAPQSLATAGTGDVLAGAIGGFLAQGLNLLDAGALALFVGALAARRVEERVGTLGLVASDLPLAMAEVLQSLEQKQGEWRD